MKLKPPIVKLVRWLAGLVIVVIGPIVWLLLTFLIGEYCHPNQEAEMSKFDSVRRISQSSGICSIHHVPLKRGGNGYFNYYGARGWIVDPSWAEYRAENDYPNSLDYLVRTIPSGDFHEPFTTNEAIYCPICQHRSEIETRYSNIVSTLFVPQVQALLSLTMAIGASILFWKYRGVPVLLVLIGSVSYFVLNAIDVLGIYVIAYKWIPADSPFWHHWSVSALDHAAGIGTVCLPFGLLWFALRTRRDAKTSELHCRPDV